MPWNPGTYHKFQNERFLPFEDVCSFLEVRDRLSVIDLGCGTGELTEMLADRLPGSIVLGVDSSPEMLEKAQKQVRPGLRFELGTIETVTGAWDVVFSHAAIHWVANHRELIPKLVGLVKPGGQLAVQLPSNQNHPAHLLIGEIAQEEPFQTALGGWLRVSPVLNLGEYAELLYQSVGNNFTVFEKVYPHILKDADAIADWTSGTTLVPYFERLPQALHEAFQERYRPKYHKRYYPYKYPRLFVVLF